MNLFPGILRKSQQKLRRIRYDGKANTLRGFAISALNELPHVKPDLVRTDDDREKWNGKWYTVQGAG